MTSHHPHAASVDAWLRRFCRRRDANDRIATQEDMDDAIAEMSGAILSRLAGDLSAAEVKDRLAAVGQVVAERVGHWFPSARDMVEAMDATRPALPALPSPTQLARKAEQDEAVLIEAFMATLEGREALFHGRHMDAVSFIRSYSRAPVRVEMLEIENKGTLAEKAKATLAGQAMAGRPMLDVLAAAYRAMEARAMETYRRYAFLHDDLAETPYWLGLVDEALREALEEAEEAKAAAAAENEERFRAEWQKKEGGSDLPGETPKGG